MARQVLPLVARPTSYKLEINPDPVSLEFSGTVDIAIKTLANTREFYLNVNEVQVYNVLLKFNGQEYSFKFKIIE